MDPKPTETESTIARWFGVLPPNDPSRRMAADLEATIRAFEAQRGLLAFEDEPSSFEAALQATKERPAGKESGT
jgi:hypothetical protein